MVLGLKQKLCTGEPNSNRFRVQPAIVLGRTIRLFCKRLLIHLLLDQLNDFFTLFGSKVDDLKAGPIVWRLPDLMAPQTFGTEPYRAGTIDEFGRQLDTEMPYRVDSDRLSTEEQKALNADIDQVAQHLLMISVEHAQQPSNLRSESVSSLFHPFHSTVIAGDHPIQSINPIIPVRCLLSNEKHLEATRFCSSLSLRDRVR